MRQSARGLAQSKSFATTGTVKSRASVLECGSPLPLSHGANISYRVGLNHGSTFTVPQKSARGLAQSKSFALTGGLESRASVLECGSPLPLWEWGQTTAALAQPTALAVAM